MNVLIVTADLRVGGAETVALELVRALSAEGWQFTIAAVRDEGPLGQALADAGAEVIAPIAWCRADPLAAIRVARIVRRRDVQTVIVLDALRNGLLFGLLGAVLSGRRVLKLCWCHASPGLQIDEYVGRLRAYRAIGLLNATVCVSRYLRGQLLSRGLARPHVLVIENGIDLSPFEAAAPTDLTLPSDKHLLVQVANVQPWKDHRTLLEAAALLAGRRSDFHLALVGRGTDSAEMAAAVRELRLAEVVTLAGPRRDVPGILAAARICVLATHCETFGIAVLEGLAAGCAVVASDVPALREVFTDGLDGLKVPPEDPEALAAALGRLLDDADLRARLAGEGRLRAQRFPTSRMAGRFARLLGAPARRYEL